MILSWRSHLSIFVFSAIFIAIAFSVLIKHARTEQLIQYGIDPRLSPKAQQEIIECIEQKKLARDLWDVRDIQQKFPFIARIAIAQGVNELFIDIRAEEPLALVNNIYVVTESKQLVASTVFKKTVLTQLPIIAWPGLNAHAVCDDFLKVIAYCTNPIIQQTYNVLWIDEKTVELHDKLLSDFSIICNTESLPNQEIFLLAKKIYELKKNSMAEKKSSSVKKHNMQNHIIVDIRFNRQIVCKSVWRG